MCYYLIVSLEILAPRRQPPPRVLYPVTPCLRRQNRFPPQLNPVNTGNGVAERVEGNKPSLAFSKPCQGGFKNLQNRNR